MFRALPCHRVDVVGDYRSGRRVTLVKWCPGPAAPVVAPCRGCRVGERPAMRLLDGVMSGARRSPHLPASGVEEGLVTCRAPGTLESTFRFGRGKSGGYYVYLKLK